jgi:hypothetical protein
LLKLDRRAPLEATSCSVLAGSIRLKQIRLGAVYSFGMKPSRTFWVLTAVLAIGVVVFLLLQSAATSPGTVDVPKVIAAAKAYGEQLRTTGAAVPAEVSLNQLIASGLLRSNDVSGFSGMKVTVALGVDAQNLQQVLMRARLPDGTEIVALNDGSVQHGRR